MKTLLKMTVLFALIMSVIACSRLNMENYERLKMGMEKDEVESIIGGASSCEESIGSESCLWGSESGTHIKINFVGGKAVLFSHDGLE